MKHYFIFKILFLLLVPDLCLANITLEKTRQEVERSPLPEPVYDSDFYNNGEFTAAQIKLGQLLFFDKILSGNKNIACATCHHPEHGTSDGVALSLGEGAVGLGKQRHTVAQYPVTGRVPRNSPALFFLGAKQFSRLFHDGRVENDSKRTWHSGYWTPARDKLPAGLQNVLAAQVMFPVTSPLEMAGQKGENGIADAVALGNLIRAWEKLATRLQQIPLYVELFKQAFTHVHKKEDISFTDAANAIAAFETVAFRADNSPFDVYLRTGNKSVLSAAAQRGLSLFYGRAQCATCHSGKFQTDQDFHAIALPQIGPGKNDGWDQSFWEASGFFMRLEDFGRGRITVKEKDNYKFRTPSLRNVALSGPWGHAGTHTSLEDIIKHHANPTAALNSYTLSKNALPDINHIVQKTVMGSLLVFQPINPIRLVDYRKHESWVTANSALRNRIAEASELKKIELSPQDIDDLVAFLKALTDPASRNLNKWIPVEVPSGLSVDL